MKRFHKTTKRRTRKAKSRKALLGAEILENRSMMTGMFGTPIAFSNPGIEFGIDEPDNPDIVVNTTADEVDQTESLAIDVDPNTPGRQVSLRAAVQEANRRFGADDIVLPAGSFRLTRSGQNEDRASTGDLDIRGDLTIRGAGINQTFIDAGQIDRVFSVFPNVSLTLEDLAVEGGFSSYGGGIRNQGNLRLEDVRLAHNRADYGGGIQNLHGEVIAIRSELSDNRASSSGGAIYNYGDRSSTGHVTIDATDVAWNRAGFGGAIWNAYGTVQIVNVSSLHHNTATSGGAIYNYRSYYASISDSRVSASDSEFYRNSAYSGGAIFNVGLLTVDSESRLLLNGAEDYGGAIYNRGEVNVGAQVTFDLNSARSGGAIYNEGELEMENCTFKFNASDQGGAIFNVGSMDLYRVDFIFNGHFLAITYSRRIQTCPRRQWRRLKTSQQRTLRTSCIRERTQVAGSLTDASTRSFPRGRAREEWVRPLVSLRPKLQSCGFRRNWAVGHTSP